MFFTYVLQLMYLAFVALYTYMLLVDLRPDHVTATEYICVAWIFTFFVDNIHTVSTEIKKLMVNSSMKLEPFWFTF